MTPEERAKELADEVIRMLDMQREYFAGNKGLLGECKAQERKVRGLARAVQAGYSQGDLFRVREE